MVERRKLNFVWIIISILSVIFAVITFKINELMETQTNMVSDLSQVEYLSSSTQRLSRMVITGDKDDKLVYYIDDETSQSLNFTSENSLSLIENDDVRKISDQVIENWKILYTLFDLDENDSEATYDIDSIKLASDNHFSSMTDLSLLITSKTYELSAEIDELQIYSYICLILIVFSLGNYLISTTIALKSSAELAIIASLDNATGLYNRSKCQELFKDGITPNNREQQQAIIVIDLNDLKKANDVHGHRVGDELITSFANILKDAINLHSKKPFLGRYGGDEFVVFYNDIENEDEIKSFMSELSYLVDEFNKQESRKYVVSYAIGYAINISGDEKLSTRQLFEEADENMYENKKQIKKAKLLENIEVNEKGGEVLA
ncbi:MAG: GGDEF domain-containing protein [Clostridia bacterium]